MLKISESCVVRPPKRAQSAQSTQKHRNDAMSEAAEGDVVERREHRERVKADNRQPNSGGSRFESFRRGSDSRSRFGSVAHIEKK